MVGWLFRVLLAASLSATVETALFLPVFPAAASTGTGLLSAFILIARVFAFVALPAAGLAVVLERAGVRLKLPDPARLLAAMSATVVVAFGLHRVVLGLLHREIDFSSTRSGLLFIAALVALPVGFFLTDVILTPALRAFLRHAPNLGTPRAVSAFVLVLMAIVSMGFGHVVLAPVHLVELAAFTGGASVFLWLAAARVAIPDVPRRLATVGAGLLVVLVVSLPFDRSRAGRFILFGPASTAGPIAAALRDLVDRDGDGTAPSWAGGTDCAEADPTRGPLVRDVPGDGIDQDCHGGDVSAAAAKPTPRGPARTAWTGCRPFERPPSVLLVTIDAMRADALNSRVSPHLMDLARASVVFERAYSPATMTGASMAALFSGRPLTDLNDRNVLMDDALVVTGKLVDRFREAGYRTASFNAFALNESIVGGFEERNPYPLDIQPRGKGQLLAAAMTEGVLAYLGRFDPRPAFVWVHYLDTHAPYAFEDAPGPRALTPYERGVAYVDLHVGRLLTELGRRDGLRGMVIAVLADHGEDLGRRFREGHGAYLFEDATRVPLLIWGAGCIPRVVPEAVSTLRLGATLGLLAGVAVPGHDLLPGGTDPALPVVVEEASVDTLGFKRAIIRGSHKLIVDERNGGRMLFDLGDDPGESRDVYDARPALARELEASYQAWLDHPALR